MILQNIKNIPVFGAQRADTKSSQAKRRNIMKIQKKLRNSQLIMKEVESQKSNQAYCNSVISPADMKSTFDRYPTYQLSSEKIGVTKTPEFYKQLISKSNTQYSQDLQDSGIQFS